MIKMLELREMIKVVNQSSIDEFMIKNKGVRISIKKSLPVITEPMVIEEDPQVIIKTAINEAAVALDVSLPESIPNVLALKGEIKESELCPIVSPVVGVFSSSPAPGTAPYVKVGDTITVGSIVCSCIVEALKLFHEIKSDVIGEIVEILVEDGQLVEYGQPLFLVKPKKGGMDDV